jgi:hypothetical protein
MAAASASVMGSAANGRGSVSIFCSNAIHALCAVWHIMGRYALNGKEARAVGSSGREAAVSG